MKLAELRRRLAAGEHIYWQRDFKNLYKCLVNMYHRCYNPKCKSYKNYGARGIRICKSWNKDRVGMEASVQNFVLWSLENGYQKGLTIERTNVHRGYYRSNCRWIPMRAQYVNKQKSKISKHTGVYPRVKQNGWVAAITVKGECIYLGFYNKEIDAALAYDAFVIANGLNRKLNFPELCKEVVAYHAD